MVGINQGASARKQPRQKGGGCPRTVFIGCAPERRRKYGDEGDGGENGARRGWHADAGENAEEAGASADECRACTGRRPEIMQTAANSIEVHRK